MRGGEHRGVLDQFGQQVDHVGDGVAAQGAVHRRDELDPGVLLDLRDGRAQHLGHGDRVAPLAPGDGPAEDGEVLRVAADPGGQVVDVEEALQQVGVLDLVLQLVEDLDLAVDQGLQPPGEVDEDLDLLFVAGGAEELGGLDDGGDRGVLGPPHLLGEQVEGVAVGGGRRRGPPGPDRFSGAELLHHPLEFGLALGAGAAEPPPPVEHGTGHAVGAEVGGRDGGDGQGGRSAKCGPEARGRVDGTVPDGEDDGCRAAEKGGDGGEQRGAQQLGPYAALGGRLGGARPGGGRVGACAGAAVPPALAAVRSRGGCAKLRHQRPRYGGTRNRRSCRPCRRSCGGTCGGRSSSGQRSGRPGSRSTPLITEHTR
ncbi:hypothetical protein HFP70_32045 [Streptomyces sp. ARC14]|uniref:hypothetical protein n=1 Tax=Streptomyces sp. ARC14 TaxID=2724152 RepID=UPI0038577CD5